MLTKLFIVAFAIIGIAVRPSAGQTAKEVIDTAYNATIGGGISLKFTLWRAANCPSEATISRGTAMIDADQYCYFCICGVTTAPAAVLTDNCDLVACPSTTPATVLNTWNPTTTPTPTRWSSIREAVGLQVYSVDDGFCYADISATTGRTLRCFAHR